MANKFTVDGNAGVGTEDPQLGLLEIQLTAEQAAQTRQGLALSVATDNNPAMLYARQSDGGHTWYFTRNQQEARGLALDPNGHVTAGQNLNVAGTLTVGGAATFQGDLSIAGALTIRNWEISVPDYVFDPERVLPDLETLADYVHEHRHLPGIPSEAQLREEGLDLARMLFMLLEKIEELTLYLVEQEGRLRALEIRLGERQPSSGTR